MTIWFEAFCQKERIYGYLFRTWREADTWLYRNGRSSGVNWHIREVERPDGYEPIRFP